MNRSFVFGAAVGCALGHAGCGDAVLLEVTGDREVPRGIDSICVGVADLAAGGGQFGRSYRLEGKLASLPQTLRLEPGGASTATAWVRGDRGGVAVARATATVDFGSDVTLALDRCPRGAARPPELIGEAAGPAAARLVASQGPGGTIVVAIGATESAVLDGGSSLVATAGPAPPAGVITAAIAADIDGDCDDDLVIASDAEPPVVWRRDGKTFTPAEIDLGGAPVHALAAADVDRDGEIDLAGGIAGTLVLWRNDAGRFAADADALEPAGLVTSVRALAFGDLDGDGNPDLVVGQAGAPLRGWFGSTDGRFLPTDAAVPPVPLDVRAFALTDADNDYDPDLAVAVAGGPMQLYIDREGRLENQSFVRVPQPAPEAFAVAIGSWDGGCTTDAVIASAGTSAALSGDDDGALTLDAMVPAATDVVMTDLDDDGDLDAVIATENGARWLAR